MNQITPMIDNSGTEYDIPNNELKDFQADMGTGAQRQYLYRTEDGTDYAIPESESKDFLADFPNAQPVRRFQFADGSTEDVPANEVKAFFDRYETDDKYKADRDERDAKKAELKAKFDKINADADSPVWAGVKEGFKSFGRYLWNPAEEYRRQFGNDNIGTQMFTGADDAANALVAGVIKILSGIEKTFGFALGGRTTKAGNYFINDAQGFEAAVDRNLPQNKKAEFMDGDALEWANKVQNMSSTLFNFTLAGGVGAAGAPTIVAIDSTDAYIDNYDRAIARGAKPEEANAIATEGFMWNAILEGTLINGGIKPMYKGAEKLAATPTIDLTKQTFSGITRGLTVGTLRNYAAKTTGHILSTGAIMGTDAMGKELLRQDADGEERNWTKVWEAGKGGGTEGALMGLMFGTASGMTAASEFRAYHKAMKKTFGDLAMRNINTAQGREMMSKVNPKGTYDFLKAREDGGTPSRKQADRMILPDDLSAAERAKIADDFLRDGITPERIKAEMEAKKPGPKATDIEAEVVEPPKPALTGPETGVEPPTKTPKGVESPESGAVRPVGASEVARVGEKTTPGAEKPVEAVSGASVEGALAAGAEKAAVKPAETAPEVPEEAHSPVLSGDEVRKTMPGYDPKNWRTHVDKSGYVAPRMEKQFQELLSTRKGKGNGEVVFLAGGNGSGKSTFVSGLGSTPDFIVDSTLGNLKTAKKQIDAVLANGQKPVIDYVYRAPEEALEGVMERVENGGHVVSPLSFADSHTKGIKNLRLLADEYGDKISVHVIDGSAEGSPEITLEQLEAKGIPDHAEIRKRANEVLGQYGALVGDGGAKGPAGGGGEVKGAEAQKGDGKAGFDRDKGRADGREAQGEGGGADKGAVAVDRTGVPDWLDDNGVAEIFNAQNFNDGWGSAVSAFFRHRVRTDERLAGLRKQYAAETDEAKRKKLNNQYKKRVNELWEHQGVVQPQDEMRDAVNAIMDREGSVASQNFSKKDKALKAWNRRYEDVKKLTGAVFDETALSNGDLMKFRKLHENYAKGEEGAADALKKFVEEHQPNESSGPLKTDKPAATEEPKTTAEKVPATSGTRRRITQAYNKWMTAEKPTKETKAKIRASIEKATSGLTEAQASQLADAYEAYWEAHVNEANAIRAERAGTVHAVQWRKEAAAAREKAGAKVQKLMEDFEIEIDRDGTWVHNPVNGAKAETSMKPAGPAKAEGTAKKSVTVENATPEDVAQIIADRYNQLHAKDANPQKAEPSRYASRYAKTAELLLKNIRDKNADGLISTVANGQNPGSLRAFEVLTGIKMPRSQRDQRAAIERYCGIAPEARAKMEAERKADAEVKAEAERRATALADGERIAKETCVKLKTGEVTTAQKLLEAGWTIKKAKRGAVTNLHLVEPDGSGYFRIDGKAFEYMDDFIAKRAKDGATTTPAKGDFLPGGVIEARRALEGDNGKPPDGWRYLATREGNYAVKVPDEKTLRDYIEKNFGKIEGGIESGVTAGGNLYNVNEILLKMAGARKEVKPMHQTVREANDSTSITPQSKLDTFRDYAKSVVSRDGATIADVRYAMYNVDVWPQGSIGETGVNAPDIFFNRLQKMMSDAFRADSRAQGIDAKYRKAESEGERQVLADQFRQYQRQFADNFLKTRRDEILKAFDEIELKPGETVEDAAKREAGVEQKSIGDEAKEIADDVDAAIDAEEAEGGNPAAPANAPRGRGTGALPHDQPKSHGPGTKGRKIVTPQTFLRRAQELFPDVAFRRKGTARMKTWAAAHFEPAIRLIRAKDMNAIGDVSHELGHDIEHLTRYDVPKLPAVKRDLSDLGHQLYGPGTPKPPSYIGEGFAEYVRGYIVNAPNLHQVAPDLDDWFKGAFKQKHPDIVKKLDELRDMVQTMKEQSAAQTVGGFMRPSTETVTRAWKKTLDFFSGENWNDSASIILRGMKKSGIARLYHWQDDFRKLEASKDYAERRMLADVISDKIENHPYIFATITRGTASQRVMDMARHGTTSLLGNKKTGESLKDIFADFSPAERDAWKKYAIAKHGIVNYFDKGLDFGLPRDVLEEVVQQYETPKFQDALRRYTDYSHRILHLGVDAGLISQDTYDKIVANHPIYVRITRRYAQDGAGTRQSGQAINRRTGGFDHILDPIDAALMDQEKYLRACFQAKTLQLIIKAGNRASAENVMSITANGGPNRNNMNPQNEAHNPVGAYWPVRVPNAQEAVKFSSGKLGKQLSQAAQDFAAATGADPIPLGDFVKDLTEDNTSLLTIFREKPSYGKHNLVSVYVEGELQTYELPDMKWANMLTDVYDKSEFSALEKTFGLATAGIRLGATTVNPGFAIRNGIRDSLHSAVMSESGALPGISTLNGMLQQLLGSEAAELFRAMGGHMSDLVGITKEQKWNHGGKVALAQNPLQTVGAYSPIDWVLMKPVVKACADVLSFPELGPRVREMSGVMAKCRKAGLSEDACAILAMSHAKDISIDFQRAGRLMKHINHFIPFSNAMWRGTEQTARNFGLLPALPHQFEDRNPQRAARNIGRGLAYITSWVTALAMLEMSGDDKDRRKAFEQSATEKWEYAHIGDWRFPLPFELGFVFGAIPKAAIYEMYGDEGAMKECLAAFNQAMPSKYVNPDTAVGSISLFTPWIGLLRNQDYRGRPIVQQHIMDNREKQDWYTQYTTELSKKIGGFVGASPAQLEYLLDSYTGGLYRRTALMAENIGDTSRLQEGRGFSMLDTLRARPQANRLIEDFYNFGVEGKRKLGSGTISLEEYGKLASQNGVKKQLTAKFDEMRAIRADKSILLAEQDRRVNEVAEQANEIVRMFNARDDYRQRGIAYAASALTGKELSELDAEDREKYLGLLKGVSKDDIVNALISFGGELVPVKERGVETFHQRWSAQNINQRVGRLLMLMQD